MIRFAMVNRIYRSDPLPDSTRYGRRMGDRAGRTPETENLMVQISRDNVAQVHRNLSDRCAEAEVALQSVADLLEVPACALDPVSQDARVIFQAKVAGIVDVHTALLNELIIARDNVAEAAASYGVSEEETAAKVSAVAPPLYRGPSAIR